MTFSAPQRYESQVCGTEPGRRPLENLTYSGLVPYRFAPVIAISSTAVQIWVSRYLCPDFVPAISSRQIDHEHKSAVQLQQRAFDLWCTRKPNNWQAVGCDDSDGSVSSQKCARICEAKSWMNHARAQKKNELKSFTVKASRPDSRQQMAQACLPLLFFHLRWVETAAATLGRKAPLKPTSHVGHWLHGFRRRIP
eukprot:530365-Rhodomonas_salina.1